MTSESSEGLPLKRTILIGGRQIEVTEPEIIQTVVADLYTDVRLVNGTTFAVSFATIVREGDGEPEARICARLRISLETLGAIQRNLEAQIAAATKAQGPAN